MATVAQMRDWLRDQGEDVPERGRLRPELIAKYKAAHESVFHPDPVPDDPDWDLGGDDPLAGADETEPSVPMQAERAPRTARAARAETRTRSRATRTDRLVGRLLGGPADAKGKPKAKAKAKPRMSLEKFTSRIYTQLGRFAEQSIAPATGRCIQAQAAMAGVLLEEMVQGTVVDRLLQPAARAEDKLDKGFALFAPPLVVFAMEQNQAAVQAGVRSPQQGMVRQAMLTPMLRESLRIGLEVSEAYADQIKARLELDRSRDAEVDKLIALIFGVTPAEAEPEMAGAAA